MPCQVFWGSCSLCPWCGEERCPHFHDHDNDKRYWIYATDRKKSYHILQANLDTKEEVIEFVKKLPRKKWGKEFRWSYRAKEKTAKGWKVEDEYLPYVELTITDGEYSWYTAVNLLVNTEEKSISYYNIWKTRFHHHPDVGEPRNIEIVGPWDEKLEFIHMEELPWYSKK